MKSRTPRKSESRRQEAKRQRSEHRETIGQRIIHTIGVPALLIWAAFYVAVLLILLSGGESMPWRLHQPVDRDLTARVGFEVENRQQAERDREVARTQVPNIYTANAFPLEKIRSEMAGLLELAKSSTQKPEEFKREAAAKGWSIGEEGRNALLQYAADDRSRAAYDQLIAALTHRLGIEYIVNKEDDPNRRTTPHTSIFRRRDEPDRERFTSELQYVTDAEKLGQTAAQVVQDSQAACPEALRSTFADLILRTLRGPDPKVPAYNPPWLCDANATRDAMLAAAASVPPSMERYEAGEVLVKTGTVLTPTDLELLRQEHQQFLQAQQTDPDLRRTKRLTQLGTAVVALLVTVGLATYTASYQVRIFKRPARTLGLAGLTLLVVALGRLDVPAAFSVGSVVVSAMLLTIAYDQRFAFGAGGAQSMFVTLSSGGDFGLFLTVMVAMSIAVFSLREVRTRSKIIAVGGMAALGALAAAAATALAEGQAPWYALARGLAAGGAAVLAGFIGQGILPYFERFFGIATSMTLLEWCDANRPLLRRLNQEAPGTYSHSVLLGQMVEEAAEAIGARGLLARVGALYHDIGKMQKAEYFVENQEARMNRHDRLSPTMSLLIIVSHVKDGVEMARAYGLPRALHPFIAEHHGTTVVKYFHHAATEAAARSRSTGRHDRDVPESEFRYPGPKPRFKETAILMICDTCEGAVRALDEPTPGRIESTVHQMIMDRLRDGQFDDCEITLRELKVVEQSLVKSLCAIHHGRVKYPKAGVGEVPPAPPGNGQPHARAAEAPAPSGPAPRTPEVVHQA